MMQTLLDDLKLTTGQHTISSFWWEKLTGQRCYAVGAGCSTIGVDGGWSIHILGIQSQMIVRENALGQITETFHDDLLIDVKRYKETH